MKMETPLTAPFAGTVAEVLTASNVQLDAGQPVLRLEPTAETARTRSGELVDLTRLQRQRTSVEGGPPRRPGRPAPGVLGYDLPDDTVRSSSVRWRQRRPDDEVVRAELDVLRIHADIAALSRNRRLGDDEDRAEQRSAREHLHAFLRTFDADALPGSFVAKLRRALAHHAISSLDRTPQLEEALFRIHLAQARSHAHVPVIVALLDRSSRPARCPAARSARSCVRPWTG
jgi:multidrug efflux pump subunit AcrA (membrane-fusion protein)